MLECKKRQKVVKNGVTTFRCVNKGCEAWGQSVNEQACSLCPVRSEWHVAPCKPHQPQPQLEDKPVPVENPVTLEELEKLDVTTPEYPAMSLQVWLYKEALLKWNKAGRPVRTAEEVETILTTHCKKCDWFDPDANRCKGCGCKVTNSSVAIFNKLKMKTEKCPKGLW